MKKPHIRVEIEKRLDAISGKCQLDAETVMRGYKKLLEADPRRLVDDKGQYRPLHELDDA